MDKSGELSITYTASVNNFVKQKDDSNPRFCMGLREKGSEDEYDMVQMSMHTFLEGKWYSKDGMSAKPADFCNAPWDDQAEADNDWINNVLALPYDANKKTLSTSFTRKLVGSSQ